MTIMTIKFLLTTPHFSYILHNMMPNDMSGTPSDTSTATQVSSLPVPEQTYAQKRLAVMQKLQSSVRLNDYGLPTAIYRPDQVPADLFDRTNDQQAAILQVAQVSIQYEGALPVIEGRLYWEQLPWEPKDEYASFTTYRALQSTYGYRSLNLLLPQLPDDSDSESDPGPDQEAENRILASLRQHYVYYAWGFRAKAFDMVANVAYDRLRERRSVEVENYHYLRLDRMLKRINKHWDAFEDDSKADAWNELGIADTVKIMGQVMQLQRVAAGLPAASPLSSKEAGGDPLRGMPMETRMTHQAKTQAALENHSDEHTLSAEDILKDPKLAEMAQRLILAASNPPKAQSDTGVTDITNIDTEDPDAAATKRAEIVAESTPDFDTNVQTEGQRTADD